MSNIHTLNDDKKRKLEELKASIIADREAEREAKLIEKAEKEAERLREKAEREAEKAEREAERLREKAEREAEKAIKLREKEIEKAEREVEKESKRIAKEIEKEKQNIDKNAKKGIVILSTEQSNDAKEIVEFFANGGCLNLFADIESSHTAKRVLGGVLVCPSRKNKYENSQIQNLTIDEEFDCNVISRSLSAAGLYRAGAKYRIDKERLTPSDIKACYLTARSRGLFTDSSPDDNIVVFNDSNTINQLVSLLQSDGKRTCSYSVGKVDALIGIFDGRLLPVANRGMACISRPFRNFIIDQTSKSMGYVARDCDFECCYIRILLEIGKAYGFKVDTLSDYVENYSQWKSEVEGVKSLVIVSIFTPDGPIRTKKAVFKRKNSKADLLFELESEVKNIGMKCAKEFKLLSDLKRSYSCEDGRGGGSTSPLGSSLSRILQRVERGLVDEAVSMFLDAGFKLLSFNADGFVIVECDKSLRLSERKGFSSSSDYFDSIKDSVNKLYGGCHVLTVKAWEYPNTPEELDEPTGHAFDYEHPTFGQLSYHEVMRSHGSSRIFNSLSDLYTCIFPFALRIGRVVAGSLVVKLSGTYPPDSMSVNCNTGEIIVPRSLNGTAERSLGAEEFHYKCKDEVKKISFSSIVDIFDKTSCRDIYSTMLPPCHPRFCKSKMFSTRLRPAGVRNPYFDLLSIGECREIIAPILFHFETVLCCSIKGAYNVFLDTHEYALRSGRCEVEPILYGSIGGEIKSLPLVWFAVNVIGLDASLVECGIDSSGNRFMSEREGVVYVIHDEMRPGVERKLEQQHKNDITREQFPVENKGVDKKRMEYNCSNHVGLTNYAETIRYTPGISRRVMTLTVSTKYVGDDAYIASLKKCMDDPRSGAAYAKLLLTDGGVPMHLNPSNPNDVTYRTCVKNIEAPIDLEKRITINSERAVAIFNGLSLSERSFYLAFARVAVCRLNAIHDGVYDTRFRQSIRKYWDSVGFDTSELEPSTDGLFLSLEEICSEGREALDIDSSNKTTLSLSLVRKWWLSNRPIIHSRFRTALSMDSSPASVVGDSIQRDCIKFEDFQRVSSFKASHMATALSISF